MKTEDILNERGKRYGNYLQQATITRDLVATITARAPVLTADQADALQMICMKISRIVNGDPDHADSWADIAGYATLVAERLEGKAR